MITKREIEILKGIHTIKAKTKKKNYCEYDQAVADCADFALKAISAMELIVNDSGWQGTELCRQALALIKEPHEKES